MVTQWRIGAAGPTGLDYNVLPIMFKRFKVEDEDQMFDDLTVMERAALSEMTKRNKR